MCILIRAFRKGRADMGRNKKALLGNVIATGALAAGGAVAARKLLDHMRKNEEKKINAIEDAVVSMRDYGDKKVYLAGGGLASMACAAYLIRDCGFPGKNITIFESKGIIGGSNDGIGTPERGFLCRGGRMLNEETYENFWDLMASVPSLSWKGHSVTEEILNFDRLHPTHAQARLVDGCGNIVDVRSMGFDNSDRLKLLKLFIADERELDDKTIEDWFGEKSGFFNTSFWHMWQTTFAFQEWSSLFEFRRYLRRMIFEFSRIETLEGVTRTPLNQYDSVIRPLEEYLKGKGVKIERGATVTDVDFAEGPGIVAEAISLETEDGEKKISLNHGDICIVTNGCMTDSSTTGSLDSPAPYDTKPSVSAELWRRIADKKPGKLGNPEPFFDREEETSWESFTVTLKGDELLKEIEHFSGNIPGSGALLTFRDSGWKLSSVVAAQPHFVNQPSDVTVFWGYGLYPSRNGDYVKKPMRDCTGREILREYLCQLHLSEERIEELMETVINVIPCYMPYIDAQFEPRRFEDRPEPVPEGSENFAMIGQFVEIPEDMVFTEEYSVRAARIAAYKLMNIKRPIAPVTPYFRDPVTLIRAAIKAFK